MYTHEVACGYNLPKKFLRAFLIPFHDQTIRAEAAAMREERARDREEYTKERAAAAEAYQRDKADAAKAYRRDKADAPKAYKDAADAAEAYKET